jgi:hypothetical protein
MSAELGAWLRQQRQARGWARPEMARQLIKAAQASGDRSVPGLDSMCHNIYRWERGARKSHRPRTSPARGYTCPPPSPTVRRRSLLWPAQRSSERC